MLIRKNLIGAVPCTLRWLCASHNTYSHLNRYIIVIQDCCSSMHRKDYDIMLYYNSLTEEPLIWWGGKGKNCKTLTTPLDTFQCDSIVFRRFQWLLYFLPVFFAFFFVNSSRKWLISKKGLPLDSCRRGDFGSDQSFRRYSRGRRPTVGRRVRIASTSISGLVSFIGVHWRGRGGPSRYDWCSFAHKVCVCKCVNCVCVWVNSRLF